MGVHGTFDLAGSVAIEEGPGLSGDMLSPQDAGNADCTSSAPALSGDFCSFSTSSVQLRSDFGHPSFHLGLLPGPSF